MEKVMRPQTDSILTSLSTEETSDINLGEDEEVDDEVENDDENPDECEAVRQKEMEPNASKHPRASFGRNGS